MGIKVKKIEDRECFERFASPKESNVVQLFQTHIQFSICDLYTFACKCKINERKPVLPATLFARQHSQNGDFRFYFSTVF